MSTCLNILVIEDHDDLRELTVEVLNQQGHHAVGFPGAEELNDVFSGFDLLIVDLNLPGEDGLSLARRFRLALPDAGIVMVTAREQAADKVRGYESGADIYLTKPLSTEELVAAVNALTRRLASAVALRLETSGLCLHGPKGRVHVSDTESAMLGALVHAPGQRLAFWQLLELLGLSLDDNSKTNLEIRIVRLRKKMVMVGADKTCIRAIRLHGYQLCVDLSVT